MRENGSSGGWLEGAEKQVMIMVVVVVVRVDGLDLVPGTRAEGISYELVVVLRARSASSYFTRSTSL